MSCVFLILSWVLVQHENVLSFKKRQSQTHIFGQERAVATHDVLQNVHPYHEVMLSCKPHRPPCLQWRPLQSQIHDDIKRLKPDVIVERYLDAKCYQYAPDDIHEMCDYNSNATYLAESDQIATLNAMETDDPSMLASLQDNLQELVNRVPQWEKEEQSIHLFCKCEKLSFFWGPFFGGKFWLMFNKHYKQIFQHIFESKNVQKKTTFLMVTIWSKVGLLSGQSWGSKQNANLDQIITIKICARNLFSIKIC